MRVSESSKPNEEEREFAGAVRAEDEARAPRRARESDTDTDTDDGIVVCVR